MDFTKLWVGGLAKGTSGTRVKRWLSEVEAEGYNNVRVFNRSDTDVASAIVSFDDEDLAAAALEILQEHVTVRYADKGGSDRQLRPPPLHMNSGPRPPLMPPPPELI